MNKLFNKIAAGVVGLAMAVGVGVAIGSQAKAEARSVKAAVTWTSVRTLSVGDEIVIANSSAKKELTGVSGNIGTATDYATANQPNGTFILTVEAGSTAGSFAFKNGNNYLAYNGSGNNLNTATTKDGKASWTINGSAGSIRLYNVQYDTRRLVYNSGSPRFCCYTSNQSALTLYKKGGGAVDGVSVSVNPSTLSLDLNGTVTGQVTATATTTGSATKGLSATSSDTTVATISTASPTSGTAFTVTGHKVGSATITVKSTWDQTKSAAVTVNVTDSTPAPFEAEQYALIKSTSELVAGSKYLIGASGSNNNKFISTDQATNNRKATTGTVTNEKVTSTADMQVITLGGSSGAWTLHATGGVEGYLYTAATSSNKLLTRAADSDNNSKWSITVSNTGVATIHNVGNTDRGQMKYNSADSLFACYATGGDLCIYKLSVTTPSVTIAPEIGVTLGESMPSLDVETENFSGTPTFSWTSSDTSVATVSGTSATPTVNLLAAGTTTLTVTATYDSQTANASCELTVYSVPTELQVKIDGQVATSETILSQYEGRARTPSVKILPEGSNQNYTISIISETVNGSFSINNHVINYVKPGTGVVRFTSDAKSSIYFDLNVECIEDSYIEDTFAYTGVALAQYEGVQFNPSGLTFTICRETAPDSPKTVSLNEISFNPSVLTSSTTAVVATHVPSGQSLSIPVTVNEVDAASISDFYDGTINVPLSTATPSKTDVLSFTGTVIAIESNSYYLQDGEYGILVYGGKYTPAAGMKIGDLVLVTAAVTNYKGYLIETAGFSASPTCTILGTGPALSVPVLTTVQEFTAQNQSTKVSLCGLSLNEAAGVTSITWSTQWAQGSSNGIATVKDSTGATISLYVSKYLSSEVGGAIVSKINSITNTDTFDLFQGVKAINSNNGNAELNITSADSIVIHHADEDYIQTWIDQYMYMDDPSFSGQGTGLCDSQRYYVNAKAALSAVNKLHTGAIATFQSDSKYAAALARYTAWASACGDATPFDGASSIQNRIGGRLFEVINEQSGTAIAITVASILSVAALGGYFFLKKKKITK